MPTGAPAAPLLALGLAQLLPALLQPPRDVGKEGSEHPAPAWSWSEQGAGDGRGPSQLLAFDESSLCGSVPLFTHLPAPIPPQLAGGHPEGGGRSNPPAGLSPTRGAAWAPSSSPHALTPAQLLSYRNMFPSNLIEASFQQVSPPGPSSSSGEIGMVLGLAGLLSPIHSLDTSPFPSLHPLPPSLLPDCFLLTPGCTQSRGGWWGTQAQGHRRTPPQKQHDAWTSGTPPLCSSSPVPAPGSGSSAEQAHSGTESWVERLGWPKEKTGEGMGTAQGRTAHS